MNLSKKREFLDEKQRLWGGLLDFRRSFNYRECCKQVPLKYVKVESFKVTQQQECYVRAWYLGYSGTKTRVSGGWLEIVHKLCHLPLGLLHSRNVFETGKEQNVFLPCWKVSQRHFIIYKNFNKEIATIKVLWFIHAHDPTVSFHGKWCKSSNAFSGQLS